MTHNVYNECLLTKSDKPTAEFEKICSPSLCSWGRVAKNAMWKVTPKCSDSKRTSCLCKEAQCCEGEHNTSVCLASLCKLGAHPQEAVVIQYPKHIWVFNNLNLLGVFCVHIFYSVLLRFNNLWTPVQCKYSNLQNCLSSPWDTEIHQLQWLLWGIRCLLKLGMHPDVFLLILHSQIQ